MLWWDISESTPGVPAPWRMDPRAFVTYFQSRVPSGSMALGVIDPRGPGPDELLLTQGWLRKGIEQWCEQGHRIDPLLAMARQTGLAMQARESAHVQAGLPLREHLLTVMVPESLPDRWWWLMLGRDGAAFTPMEQRLALLQLRQLQTAFNQTSEPNMHRMVLGHDDRLIHADPAAQEWMLRTPDAFDQLVRHLHTLVPQRWPSLEEDTGHDFAVALGGQPRWVCFYVTGVSDLPGSRRWYIESRPLEADELPLVDALPDDRIAQAVGYMHDHFQESPSLTKVAQAVHVSAFHFHRLFSRLVGVSPKQYLQRKQLQAAKWLLRTTRLPIGTVAVRAGFSSHGHFTSTFHRVIGTIPSQYRESPPPESSPASTASSETSQASEGSSGDDS